MPVFGALALAGLDVLEKGTGDTLTALLSRGVRIRMQRAGKDDRPAKVTRVTEDQGEKMRDWLEAWASQVRDEYQGLSAGDAGRGRRAPRADLGTARGTVADAGRPGNGRERARAACVELALDQATAPAEEDESTAEAFASFAADLSGSLAGAVPRTPMTTTMGRCEALRGFTPPP